MINSRQENPLVIKTVRSAVPAFFNIRGILAVAKTQQFILAGNNTKTKKGRLEARSAVTLFCGDKQAQSKCTQFAMAVQLPLESKDGTPIILTIGEDDRRYLAYQAWTAHNIQTVYAENLHGPIHCDQNPLPPPVLHHTRRALDTIASGGNADDNGWQLRINEEKMLRAKKNHKGIDEHPITSGAQYIAYSPDRKHCIAGTGPGMQAVLHSKALPKSSITLNVKNIEFRCAAWFADSTHFLIGCNGGVVTLGNTLYPNQQICMRVGRTPHAIQPLGYEAVFASSHSDGSVRVYRCDDAAALFEQKEAPRTLQVSTTADLLTELMPATRGAFSRTWHGGKKVELAALAQENGSTQLLVHERATQDLNLFSLRQINTVIHSHVFALDILTRELRLLITQYAAPVFFKPPAVIVNNQQGASVAAAAANTQTQQEQNTVADIALGNR